jgi:hypothetical protein
MPLVPRREPYGFLDAVLRYNRAREHLADVERLIDSFRTTPYELATDLDLELVDEMLSPDEEDLAQLPIPYEIPIRIGETIYNLRAALDYLIFALSWHDSGIEPTDERAGRLQFPIFSDPQVFERRRNTILEGVSDPHVAMLRDYQPCEGCTWTDLLADLSNKDKHRHLTVLQATFDPETGIAAFDLHPDPQASAEVHAVLPMGEVRVDIRATFDVVFPDGSLISETLQELESEVESRLLRFGREFTLRPL